MDIDAMIQQIESVIGETPEGVPIFQVRRNEPEGDAFYFERITRYASAILRLAPQKSIYVRMCQDVLRFHDPSKNTRQTSERLKAILLALKEDLSEQNLRTAEELIHGDLLSDFLEMADRLVQDGFKNPAAVLAGSVLAEHLRRLCTKHDVTIHRMLDGKRIPKNVSQMNDDLAALDIYGQRDKRNVEAWNDLRIKALYGKYNEFTQQEVRNTVSGIRSLMTSHPA